jgi:hypothetical protein
VAELDCRPRLSWRCSLRDKKLLATASVAGRNDGDPTQELSQYRTGKPGHRLTRINVGIQWARVAARARSPSMPNPK